MSKLLDQVVGELSKLPGIGRRTALRLAVHLLRVDREDVGALSESLSRFRNDIKYCGRCNNLSDDDLCPICSDPHRDRGVVCVVEQVKDVISIENTRQYNGLYHVLGGIISPMQGIAPSDLKIDLLLENIAQGGIREVILALNTSIEGETTAFYITRRLAAQTGEESEVPVRISSIARGIGFGDELDYADELTIAHAIHNRTTL
ncbi:MAG: recombination mediator RecR [Rikenellaceae bacterium]|nr:recombination mediator RecR [Rikenellaceae bacterium]